MQLGAIVVTNHQDTAWTHLFTECVGQYIDELLFQDPTGVALTNVLVFVHMANYELLERIGAGGMAEIFRGKAVADGGFEKLVAIKRILPHLSKNQRFVELLIAEAQTLSLLVHRNIVQIYDVGLGDDGKYFLVMEYVEGADLGELFQALELEGKRLPLGVALHIGAELCEALAHAHRAKNDDGDDLKIPSTAMFRLRIFCCREVAR